ncbi:hypothetical protein PIB30_024533 [Stylosanthes scabra]|uniref:Uncharacterized protein n=1 Tax=Stylosanthes scabra TaxID=79078 RepID=A0ABU6Q9E9_9FABA|nr:hypothetical protein [Stylosanthes scabra]
MMTLLTSFPSSRECIMNVLSERVEYNRDRLPQSACSGSGRRNPSRSGVTPTVKNETLPDLVSPQRYRLRQEDDIVLIRSWHNHFSSIHLLELFVVFADIGDSGSSGVGVNTQSSGGVGTNIRRLMVNLNMPHDGSFEDSNPGLDVPTEGILEEEIESHERSLVGDPMTHPYRVNPTVSDDEEVEDKVMHEDAEAVEDDEMDEDVSEETNFFIHGQPSLTQPAITERYDHPGHFTSLRLEQ